MTVRVAVAEYDGSPSPLALGYAKDLLDDHPWIESQYVSQETSERDSALDELAAWLQSAIDDALDAFVANLEAMDPRPVLCSRRWSSEIAEAVCFDDGTRLVEHHDCGLPVGHPSPCVCGCGVTRP